jgi:hypothetical protein
MAPQCTIFVHNYEPRITNALGVRYAVENSPVHGFRR